ncbi:anti-sigma factor [Streptomyces nitrosporeus]|uniref:anti-sigma factor n=1 Tax=Streptomyces nitrosporeus TaxID=28894 RepID=UPI0033287488
MSTAELHTLTGAYALHALPDDERRAFRRHLSACEPCAQEVRELSATAARLGLAVSVPAPPGLRERVLREVTTVRQEPPEEGRGARPVSLLRRTRRLPAYALAACLAAAVAFGGVAVWQNQVARDARQEAREARQQNERVSQVLAAPDARTASAGLAGGGRSTVVVSRDVDRAVFVAVGLEELPRDKVYQLWFDEAGAMRPAGLVTADRAGEAVLMDGPVGRASGMGVTVEPAGGSEQPTTPPLGLMGFPRG